MKKRILIQSLGLRFGANKDLLNPQHQLNSHCLLRKPTANLALGEKCAADVPPWISEELDLLACQYTACAVCMMSLVRAQQWEPKNSKPIGLDFFICVRRTQHHLTEGQHHFEQSENIISHSSGHKTMLQRVANDVMLRINDVGYAQFLSN